MSTIWAYRMVTGVVIIGADPYESNLFRNKTVTVIPVDLYTPLADAPTVALLVDAPPQQLFVRHILGAANLGEMMLVNREAVDVSEAEVTPYEDPVPEGQDHQVAVTYLIGDDPGSSTPDQP